MKNPKKIGNISNKVAKILNLTNLTNHNIYISHTNIKHMQTAHPETYLKYKDQISSILNNPDYVGRNKSDGSIEFVKEFLLNNEYVKVAVRVSNQNRYYARSMYILNPHRVENFIKKGTLIPLDNSSEL